MYRRRCEPDERVLLVRGGRFVKHTVRYPRSCFSIWCVTPHSYSTVTLLAKFLGLSTSNPLETLT